MRWKVEGDDRVTHKDRAVFVTAANQDEARWQAEQQHNMYVARVSAVVEPVRPRPPARAAARAAAAAGSQGVRVTALQGAAAAASIGLLVFWLVYSTHDVE